MTENSEHLFSVRMSWAPNGWGETVTMSLLNPDGTVCVEESWPSGPDGLTGVDESDLAEWVGEQATEFMITYFSAIAEQTYQAIMRSTRVND